jgi:hypothetical protein
MDGNRISSLEEKTAEGPFLRKETVSHSVLKMLMIISEVHSIT